MPNQTESFREFVEFVAALTKDGEPIDDPDYENDAYVMENDDAYDTLDALISDARAILGLPQRRD